MAKVQFGGGVSNIQASIGGNTFTRSKAGGGARNRVKPNNPPTPLQMQRRTQLATCSTIWGNLTEAQRLAWTAAAAEVKKKGKCGNNITLTGHQHFVSLNMNRLAMAQAVSEDPPETQNAEFVANFWGDSSAMVSQISTATIEIPIGAGALEGMSYEVAIGGPFGAGQKIKRSQLTICFLGTISAGNVAAGYVGGPTDTYFAIVGALDGQAGKKIWASCRQYSEATFAVPIMLNTVIIE